jgi:predicted amidohydrolase YtcJ
MLRLELPLCCALFGLILCHEAPGLQARTPSENFPIAADLIVTNARIWTACKTQPAAESLAVWRDRILALGSTSEMLRLAGPATRILDARGRQVVPGFFDSHLHLLGGGLQLSRVDLKDAKDEAEFGRRLQEFDRNHPRGGWMLGGAWDHDRAFGGKLPDAELLDRYVRERPVYLRRYDGHVAVANSRAMALASITAQTEDPSGGVIDRQGADRQPSGIFRDNAMGLVDRVVPAPSEADIVEAVRQALGEISRNGITSVQDMDGGTDDSRRKLFRHYQHLARQGALTARIDLRWPLAEWNELARQGLQSGFGDNWLRIGGVKGFADGSLGSSTAKMYEPYLNQAANTGIFVTPRDKLQEYISGADGAGISIAVHAIGDRANGELLDIFAAVEKQNGQRDRRFRIEHAQHLRPQDYSRFRELGVVASMQPYHVVDDGRWAEGRIGPGRCASSYAYRSLLDAGARLAFGSDWPVAPLSPLLGIDAAVNRRTLDAKNPNGWFPEQRITVAEALEAYTLSAAYAGFQEADRGSLEPGKLADFVVLSRDILDDGERNQIAQTRVLATVVGGKTVFKDPAMN